MHESERSRINRNLDQLLQEIRVALPGVQVLFAFLLTAPFNARFGEVHGAGQAFWLVALLSAAVASSLLMAPSVHHRLLFRRGRKARLVHLANTLALLGMVALAIALVSSVALVTSFLYRSAFAAAVTVAAATVLVVIWFVLPFLRASGLDDEDDDDRPRLASSPRGHTSLDDRPLADTARRPPA